MSVNNTGAVVQVIQNDPLSMFVKIEAWYIVFDSSLRDLVICYDQGKAVCGAYQAFTMVNVD